MHNIRMKGLSKFAKLQLCGTTPSKSDFEIDLSMPENKAALIAKHINEMFTDIRNFECHDNGVSKRCDIICNNRTAVIESQSTGLTAETEIRLTVTEHHQIVFDHSETYASHSTYKLALQELSQKYSEHL